MSEIKQIRLSAIDPILKTNIPLPTEKETGKYIYWGSNNLYPQFLYETYSNSSTLQSAINTICDFVCGDGIKAETDAPNNLESWGSFIHKLTLSKLIYGAYAIQVIKQPITNKAVLYSLDLCKIRYSKNKDNVYSILYCDNWAGWTTKAKSLPLWTKDELNSVFVSSTHSLKELYPKPMWSASIKSAVVESKIADYHLNAISNGFSSSYIVNFNSGQPTPEQQEEIERTVNEKFSGSENAGRILIAFNDNKENAVSLEKLDTTDFDNKYQALTTSCKAAIYEALRVNPVLLGYNANGGLQGIDYKSIYNIFNKTVIKPIQNQIIDDIKNLSGVTIEIDPFKIDLES